MINKVIRHRRTTSVTKLLGELDWPMLSDRCREARLSLFSKAAGGHSAISLMQSISAYESNTPRWSHKFHPHLCTNWCLQIFVLSTYTSRLEHSVCWSPSKVLVVCKRVSWSGRLSRDTPVVKGDTIAGYLLKNWRTLQKIWNDVYIYTHQLWTHSYIPTARLATTFVIVCWFLWVSTVHNGSANNCCIDKHNNISHVCTDI